MIVKDVEKSHSYSNISEIPEETLNNTAISRLILSHTKICEIPEEIGKLENLTLLDISFTQVEHLPECLLRKTGLTIVCIGTPILYSNLRRSSGATIVKS